MKAFFRIIVIALVPFAACAQLVIEESGDPALPYITHLPPTQPPPIQSQYIEDQLRKVMPLQPSCKVAGVCNLGTIDEQGNITVSGFCVNNSGPFLGVVRPCKPTEKLILQ